MLLHYLGKQETQKLRLFTEILHAFLPKTTRNTLKYHLVTAEPPFTVKTIDWMHQTGRAGFSRSRALFRKKCGAPP